MARSGLEQEIIELEDRYWRALRDGDVATAMRLSDDPCIVTGAQGAASLARQHLGDMLASPDWTLHEYQILDPVVRVVDDVAIIAYQVTETMTVEGEPLTLEATDASTWVRRDGEWRCALHTESIIGDPFGRDRRSD